MSDGSERGKLTMRQPNRIKYAKLARASDPPYARTSYFFFSLVASLPHKILWGFSFNLEKREIRASFAHAAITN